MKNLTFLLLLVTSSAFANGNSFRVDPFKGELILDQSDISVESVKIALKTQYAVLSGMSCTDGPVADKRADLEFSVDPETKLIRFELNKTVRHVSYRPFNSACGSYVVIHVQGTDSTGKKVTANRTLHRVLWLHTLPTDEQIAQDIAERVGAPLELHIHR